MKRLVILTLTLAFALAVLVWALRGESTDQPGAASAELPSAPVVASTRPPDGTRVSGKVVRDGAGVSRARVSLRGTRSSVVLTDGTGAFSFDEVVPGLIFLSASNDDTASEVLGPIQVGAAAIEGLVLSLAPAVKVEGVVIDLVARKPVVGATVVSPQRGLTTDKNGKFQLAGAKGATWIEVTAPGYLSRTEWVSLELARTGGLLELVLTPVSRLEGSVLEAGQPVASATVWAEQIEGATRGDRTPTVFTSKEGHFVIESSAGLVRLTGVTPRGTRLRGPLLRLSVGEQKTGLVLDAGETSEAHGVVTRGGAPLPSAQLQAIDASNEDIVGVTTSSPTGQFQFQALANGRYVVQVRVGAYSAVAGPFEQTGDGRAWAVAVGEGAALAGRVEPATPNVRVRWRSGSWSGPPTETLTDAQGRFRFEGLPTEFVSLDAEGPTGAATARAKPGDDVVLHLGHGQVVVHLTDDVGRPVTDGVLLSRSLDTGAVRRQLVLAPDGVTTLDLPAGGWELTLEVAGRGRSSAAKLDVRDAPLDVRLSLEVAVTVRGTVRDAETKLPVQNAQVQATTGEVNGFRVSVMTDAHGEYVLPPVPRGSTIVVVHEAFRRVWRPASDGDRWDPDLARLPQANTPPVAQQFEGVGMVLDPNSDRGGLVTMVNEGGPAERAGVQRGDLIIAVEGQNIIGLRLDDIIGRIRGPSGTEVHLTFVRAGQTFDLTVRRKLLTL